MEVNRPAAEQPGDVHLVQVGVQVPVDEVATGRREDQDDGERASYPGEDLLPAGPPAGHDRQGRGGRRRRRSGGLGTAWIGVRLRGLGTPRARIPPGYLG